MVNLHDRALHLRHVWYFLTGFSASRFSHVQQQSLSALILFLFLSWDLPPPHHCQLPQSKYITCIAGPANSSAKGVWIYALNGTFPPPSPFTLCQLIKSLLVKKFRFEETPLKLWTIIRDAGLAHFLRIGLPNCCTTTPLHWKSSEPPGYVCNIIFCISMWTSRNLTPQLVTTLELRHGCVAHPFFTRTSDMN